MPQKFHLSLDGEPRVCRAQNKCPLGAASEHYETAAQARKAYEESMSGSFAQTPESLSNDLKKEYPDLTLDLRARGEVVELQRIILPKEGRKQGMGTEIMEKIIKEADRNGWKLALTPDTAFGATSVARLKQFYKRFGFVDNKGRHKDWSTMNSMVRPALEKNVESLR